jgi:predicted PurR-regulated permease PerM
MKRLAMAASIIAVLGVGILIAALPFLLGLLGAPILAVTFEPLHSSVRRHFGLRASAWIVVLAGVLAIFIPAVAITALLVSEVPAVLAGPGTANLVEAVGRLRVGPFAVGEQAARISAELVSWLSRQTFSLIGDLTFVVVNLLIAFLGLYFLLVTRGEPWKRVIRYLPFSQDSIERLRVRFRDVTRATVLGIGATALLQAVIVGAGFALVGLGHSVLWGVVCGVASVLPILGSSLVWIPGVIVLLAGQEYAAAIVLGLIGFVVASNVDNLVRPIIFRKVSNIHPLITVVGAFAGMRYFGILGVLLGPLALVYFMELVQAFEHEYRAHA